MRALKLPSTCTNAAFALRIHYMKYLKDFEASQYFGGHKEMGVRSPTFSTSSSGVFSNSVSILTLRSDSHELHDIDMESDSTRSPSPLVTRSRQKQQQQQQQQQQLALTKSKSSKRYHPYTSDEEEEEIILVSDEVWESIADHNNPISALINYDGSYVVFSNHSEPSQNQREEPTHQEQIQNSMQREKDDLLTKLSTEALCRYRRLHNIQSVTCESNRKDLLEAISNHFRNQYKVREHEVIKNFRMALLNGRI